MESESQDSGVNSKAVTKVRLRRPSVSSRKEGAKVLPPCRVCGSRGTGFHYGVTTCEPCKGFFRRCLVREGTHKCQSKNGGPCPINQGTKSPCPGCRYAKCLQVGMSKDAIQLGRYNLSKKTQDIIEYKLHSTNQVKGQPTEDDITIQKLTSVMRSSLELWRKTPGVTDLHDPNFRQTIKDKLKLRLDVDLDSFLKDIAATGKPCDERFEMFAIFLTYISKLTERVVTFMKNIPGFKNIHKDDQAAIVKDSFIEIDHITHRDLYFDDLYFLCDGETISTISFGIMCSPGYGDFILHMDKRLKQLELTDEEACVLLVIMAFSPERQSFKEPCKIEAIQNHFTELLFILLRKRFDERKANMKFAEMCSVLRVLRTCGYLADKELRSPAITKLMSFFPMPPLIAELFQKRIEGEAS